MSDANTESDYFVTLDDHIFMGGKELRGMIDSIADEFIDNVDQRGRPLFDVYANRLLNVCLYEGEDSNEARDTAFRTFAFAKFIGFCALQPGHVGMSTESIIDHDAGYQADDNVLVALVSAAMNEMKTSLNYLEIINAYRPKLDPTGNNDEIVDLFAGFTLFTMQNALYLSADMDRMQADGELMSNASDEDWKRGLDDLLGDKD